MSRPARSSAPRGSKEGAELGEDELGEPKNGVRAAVHKLVYVLHG